MKTIERLREKTITNPRIGRGLDETMVSKRDLAALLDVAEAAKVMMRALASHEAWEAQLITSPVELNGVPAPTQALWDEMIDVQALRNEAIEQGAAALSRLEADDGKEGVG